MRVDGDLIPTALTAGTCYCDAAKVFSKGRKGRGDVGRALRGANSTAV